MKNRFEIAFVEKKPSYGETYTKLVIKDKESFCDYFHVGFHYNGHAGDIFTLTINGSQEISKMTHLDFYPIKQEDIFNFKRMSISNEENFRFGVLVLKGKVNYKEK